ELYALRMSERDEISDQWAVDTESAVAVEIGAALNIVHDWAKKQVSLARGLRERLPLVAATFRAGDLSLPIVETLLHRSDLITDPAILTHVDAKLAGAAARLATLSYGQLCGHVDRIIAREDSDAVRRRKKAADDRELWFHDGLDGMSTFGGAMPITDAEIFERSVDAMADTVCTDDPRTRRQRRVDAIAALCSGAERLPCQCANSDCPQKDAVAAPFVIHVVNGPGDHTDTEAQPAETAAEAEAAETDADAEPETAEPAETGASDSVASLVRNGAILPSELIAGLAEQATIRPLIHPGDAPPEPRYTPSRNLAEFVRCRDMGCRFPGCDVPAWKADIDHTVPYSQGGPTQASNLKCLCRLHHLIKTFWGWHDQQHRDGTVIWTSPAGQTYTTTPGSALLFPHLCLPTAAAIITPRPDGLSGERTAMMPQRQRTRAQNKAARIAAERQHNREQREARRRARRKALGELVAPAPPPQPGDEPPPF
ncbi:HNH endonuclease signature motif containing protein, partial [Mycolicibacterium arseniciresistens]